MSKNGKMIATIELIEGLIGPRDCFCWACGMIYKEQGFSVVCSEACASVLADSASRQASFHVRLQALLARKDLWKEYLRVTRTGK